MQIKWLKNDGIPRNRVAGDGQGEGDITGAHVSGHLGKSVFRLATNSEVIFLAKRVDSTTSLLLLKCEKDQAWGSSIQGQGLSLTCYWKEQTFMKMNRWKLSLWSELWATASAQSTKLCKQSRSWNRNGSNAMQTSMECGGNKVKPKKIEKRSL